MRQRLTRLFRRENHPQWGLCVLTALLCALAFPKPALVPVIWIAIVPLLFALEGEAPKEAFAWAWVAGFLTNLAWLYWIARTITTYTYLPIVIGWIAPALVAGLCALFWGLWGAAYRWGRRRFGLPAVVAAPALWVLLVEWLRVPITHFPWNYLGYALIESEALIQVADLTGLWGLSFLVVLVNTAIYELLSLSRDARAARSPRPKEQLARQAAGPVAALVVLALALAYGGARLAGIREHLAQAPRPWRIALVQGNIRQSLKWEPEFAERSLEQHELISREAHEREKLDLIVWSEAAATFFPDDPDAPTWRLRRLVRELDTPLLFGAPHYEDGRYYNSAFLLEPDAQTDDLPRYDKTILVPFGEYVPFSDLLFFVDRLVSAGAGDFSAGRQSEPLAVGDMRLAPLICYEVLFPELVRKFTASGANILVNITNDAWFGDTAAPWQHLAQARLRSVETRSWLVRAANTGITATINPAGELIAPTVLNTPAFRIARVGPDLEETLYERLGEWFLLACVLLLLGAAVAPQLTRQIRHTAAVGTAEA